MPSLATQQSLQIGIICLWGFVASQAVRDVYLGGLFGAFSLYEVALLAFGSAASMFGAYLAMFRRAEFRLLWVFRRSVAILNVTTMISWLLYFKALSLIEPAAVNLAFCGVAPFAVWILRSAGITSPGEREPIAIERSIYLGLLATVILLVPMIGLQEQVGDLTTIAKASVGVVCAIAAGISITAETVYARRLNLEGVSPSAIIGVRFILVTMFSAIMLTESGAAFESVTPSGIALQSVVFLFIIIGPLYLVQTGVALTGPLISGIVCAFGPIATLILQSVAADFALSPVMILNVAAYTVLALAAAFYSARPRRHAKVFTR